ncbi:uncharacterized protein LOC112575023 isoform X3 [Pomacea canaliculata]|uniref:uncharacterized protein LOC112575023 isoform X3 n=1 Tax=Pomacea canaliculata TaxID=400727 RepID=UPI000D73B6A0|nr:uncharacterized protein LOC112575023 isoform X3 [Pomacea canaliculata]XP_025112296.1 uncharacterized protein LOC112575023 isoform X3 [Pomacea canaliculata]
MGRMVPSGIRCSVCSFLVTATMFTVIFAEQDGKVTCDVPSVTALTSTSLTCHFPEDINQTRKDVSVYLYKENESPDAILDCWWLGGDMDCYSAPGYKHTKSISRQLTVTIPRAAANQTGTYACQVAGYNSDQLSTCDFSIQSGPKTICDAPSVSRGSPAWLSCYFSENVGESKRDFNIYHVSSQDSKESVLNCTWSQDSLTCHTASDYQFDRKVTNTATMKIPKVSASHTGTYSCQLAGAAPGDYEDCAFNFDQGQATSCNIPSVKLIEPATLTCDFGVDINKTKTNFNIVHFSDQNKEGVDVFKCIWQHNDLVCDVTSGFEFSRPVTDQLALTIPRANDNHAGKYSCQLQRSSNNATYCEFSIDSGSDSSVSVVVGVLIPLFILVLIAVGVLLYRRHRVRKLHKESSTMEEAQFMLPIQATDQTTERLQDSLSASIQTMYPDILTACYFVPSLYINRNKYTKDEVAGEKVVVMEAAPDDTLRHDHAIQHVLKCLRHLVDTDQQAMFVLSQFTCDDYLASVDEQFAQHKLPMPSDLIRRDKDYENFDVLIVHRQYGVVVVVVKASVCTADMGVEIRDNERVVQDLREAVKQLDGAERMLKHLMADVRPDIAIRKTLMLPNLSQKLFKDIFAKHQDIAKAYKYCTGLTDLSDISREYLCADQLQGDNMVDQLQEWLGVRHTSSAHPRLSENNYQTILSRFCGVATRPYLTLPDGRRVCTPSSHQQAVSLTGELFNGDIIHPEHQQLVSAAPPRVFLSGPPGSGKTTSLVLMGKQWLSEGHTVCVLSTWRENRTSSKFLYAMLTECSERMDKSHAPKDLQVFPQSIKVKTKSTKKDILIFEEVDLEKKEEKKEMKKIIKKMKDLLASGGLFILVDDAGPYREDQLLFKSFCERLLAVNQKLHLWAASCVTHQTPNGWDVKQFQRTVSCPPAILRDENVLMLAQKNGCKDVIKWDPDNIGVAPTEGLPVKYVYHQGTNVRGHSHGYPFACKKCCDDVITLLKASGLEIDARDIGDNCKTASTSTARSANGESASTPRLHPTDVLLLLEHEDCEDSDLYNTKLCKILKTFGFSLEVGKTAESDFSSQIVGHHLWVSNATHFRGLKRKVVVYVEGRRQSNIPLEWMRLRGVTSCTSQLIWVKDAALSHPEA